LEERECRVEQKRRRVCNICFCWSTERRNQTEERERELTREKERERGERDNNGAARARNADPFGKKWEKTKTQRLDETWKRIERIPPILRERERNTLRSDLFETKRDRRERRE